MVETDEKMKQVALVIRILSEEGSVDGEGGQTISDAFRTLAKQRDDFHQRQDNVKNKLEAQDWIIAGLWGQIKALTA